MQKKSPLFYLFLALIIVMAIAMVLLTFTYSLRSFEFFRLPWSEDQAQFSQVMWNLVNFGNLSCSIYTTPCFLAGKFDLIFFFLAPLYAFHPYLNTLLLITAICLWSTGIIIYFISWQVTKNALISFLLALLFFLYGPALNLSTMGFRETIISMPFFALGLYFYLRKNFWTMMSFLVLGAFCREDVPLILIGFSFLGIIERRSFRWKVVPGLVGFIYFYTIFCYIMPWINNLPIPDGQVFRPNFGQSPFVGGAAFQTYRHLGATPLEILKNMFLRPDIMIGLLSREQIALFLKDLLGPLFFLPLFSYFSLIPFSQYLVIFLSDRSYFSSVGTYYFAPVVPFLFAGLASLFSLIKNRFDTRIPIGTGIVICLLLFLLWSSRDNLNRFTAGLGPNPDHIKIEQLFNSIPHSATVTAQLPLLQNFSSRKWLFTLADYPNSEYVALIFGENSWPQNKDDYNKIVKRMLFSGDYGLKGRVRNIFLLQKGASLSENAALFSELFSGTSRKEFKASQEKYQSWLVNSKKLIRSNSNLIINGGFENKEGDIPSRWGIISWQKDPRKSIYAAVSEEKQDGNFSAKIEHQDLADSRWAQSVKVQPSTYYELSGWIKTKKIENKGDGAFLEVPELGAKSNKFYKTNGWEKTTLIFKTVKGQKEITVLCRLGDFGRPNIGIAYFDNLILKETLPLYDDF